MVIAVAGSIRISLHCKSRNHLTSLCEDRGGMEVPLLLHIITYLFFFLDSLYWAELSSYWNDLVCCVYICVCWYIILI